MIDHPLSPRSGFDKRCKVSNTFRFVKVEIDKDKKTANVYVTEDQQSIAIGRGGQNVRLASRLTGYELNIETTAPKSAEKKPRKNVEEDLFSAIENQD